MPTDRAALRDRRKRPLYRSWWTRERVLAGLRRLYADTGRAPNCSGGSYQRLMRELGQHGLKGGRRRYPTDQAVLRHWPTFAHAWREAGIAPGGRRVLTTSLAAQGGVGWAGRHEVGERHGRLTVVEFAGYYYWGKGGKQRKALWRCRCDCGRERVVRAGDFKHRRECEACARERGRARRGAQAEAAQRAAEQREICVEATFERARFRRAGPSQTFPD